MALTTTEADLLVSTYGRVRAPIHVIPNGVDLERFRPPTPDERARARAAVGVDPAQPVAVFVGHEFERKGLPLAIEGLRRAPDVTLLVVGGTPEMIRRARAQAEHHGVAARVVFAGTQADPIPFLWASDVLVLPSAYEANALVVLEALACGLPVVVHPRRLRTRPPASTARTGTSSIATPHRWAIDSRCWPGKTSARGVRRARETASRYSWPEIARQYLALVDSLRAERTADA